MKTQSHHRFLTPAKINPVLRILYRRPDGYHQVALALVAVSLFDTITLGPAKEGLEFHANGMSEPVAMEDNLVVKAARAFAQEAGLPPNWAITLDKHIPSGAGLGGGSGNAAGTLAALNHFTGHPLNSDQMIRLAASLGSDVPFFLNASPSWATGRGEQLTPMHTFPQLPLVILKPAFSIATASAYKRAARPPLAQDMPPFALPDLATPKQVLAALHNDFEEALAEPYPELTQWKARLLEAGAAGALLSGSGSALFGVFHQAEDRDRAAQTLASSHPQIRVFPCDTLSHHSYF
ncbi:MAG: 4-(cytidine 5'-diphospho)-2-C-methyl-D-erythritol kinase [Deltaproteobacteria bacterium]|nr:4-(cytidine 5'-diphospho)-2-C-methyl-D-erythritol kinase [Deltaproteobacteria bacterium]